MLKANLKFNLINIWSCSLWSITIRWHCYATLVAHLSRGRWKKRIRFVFYVNVHGRSISQLMKIWTHFHFLFQSRRFTNADTLFSDLKWCKHHHPDQLRYLTRVVIKKSTLWGYHGLSKSPYHLISSNKCRLIHVDG